jgi:hypothetical protein
MYHLELRQFPHNFCRFNLSEGELAAVLAPWAAGQVVEVGDRKWNPQQAKIKVLEGPELELQELSMGRGWRTAERRGQDVTDRVLTAVPAPLARPMAPASASVATGSGLADPLAALVQIGALLGPEAPRLLEAWRAAAAADPSLSPSGALAAAEEGLRASSADAQRKPPAG